MIAFEASVIGKRPEANTCEDAIVVTSHFAAVIDGATDKTNWRYQGQLGGRAAAVAIAEAVPRLDPSAEAVPAIASLSEAVEPLTSSGPPDGPSAAVAIYSRRHHQIWCVGDVGIYLPQTGRVFNRRKAVDLAASSFRAAVNSAALAAGQTIGSLLESDLGRQAIHSLLDQQFHFRNRLGPWGYGAIDGHPVPSRYLKVIKLKPGESHLVLFSDGYPRPAETLREAEALLHELLTKDPLCIGPLRGTKAPHPGSNSFDDRAFLRIDTAMPGTNASKLLLLGD